MRLAQRANQIQKFPKQTPRLRNEVNKCREIICTRGLVFIHTINWEGVSFSYRWATEWTTETRNKVPFSCPCVEKSHFPALCRKTANFHFSVVHESSSKVRKEVTQANSFSWVAVLRIILYLLQIREKRVLSACKQDIFSFKCEREKMTRVCMQIKRASPFCSKNTN